MLARVGSIANRQVNVLPLPGSLATRMMPLCARILELHRGTLNDLGRPAGGCQCLQRGIERRGLCFPPGCGDCVLADVVVRMEMKSAMPMNVRAVRKYQKSGKAKLSYGGMKKKSNVSVLSAEYVSGGPKPNR